MRREFLIALILAGLVALALSATAADDFLPPTGTGTGGGTQTGSTGARAPAQDDFQALARLASRLTVYNAHDDAATATYTCCRPDQKEQIAQAERANTLYLQQFPRSDYADDTLFHMASLAPLKENYRDELVYYERVADEYPDSDLCDDALWRLAVLNANDTAMAGRRREYLTRLLDTSRYSLHAGEALSSLAEMALAGRNLAEAEGYVRTLAETYPNACMTPSALYRLAELARGLQDYDTAGFYYGWIGAEYPFADVYDDALYQGAELLATRGDNEGAAAAFDGFLQECPASPYARQAAQRFSALTGGTPYDPGMFRVIDLANNLWEEGERAFRFRQYDQAMRAYNQLLQECPGSDRRDDALYRIGESLKETNLLCNTINDATGPEDLHMIREAWAAATGGAPMPKAGTAETASGAFQAFMDVAFASPGTNLGSDALYALAEVYEDMDVPEVRAQVFQRLIINYPVCDTRQSTEALAELLEWYVNDAEWPAATGMYLELANAYPEVFPPVLAENPDLLVAVLKFYEHETAVGWYELSHGHVYRRTFGPGDLLDDAMYVIGSLEISLGDPRSGCARLKDLLAAHPTSDYVAPALYNLARGLENLGEFDGATNVYKELAATSQGSGLADDAEDCYAILSGAKDYAAAEAALTKAEAALGRSLKGYDWYLGQNVIVFSPFMSAAKLRAYNMPNVWDQAQASLAEWTGLNERLREPQIIVLTEEPGSEIGDVIRLSARDVGDPPNWRLGLTELTSKFLRDDQWGPLAGMSPAFADAMVLLGTANLQYALVSETRDTIGSAAAVKLPFQDLIDARARCVEALEAYVQDGARGPAEVNRDVAAGMLLALLDQYGYGQGGTIDCSPLDTFFEVLAERGPEVNRGDRRACTRVVVLALSEAFNSDVSPTFAQWGLWGV